MAYSYKQGLFTPKHPEKYVGDVKKVVFRSSWELSFFEFLDGNPNILKWSSENVVIPYIKPTDGRIHRYFVDIWMQHKNKKGEIVTDIVEIKPLSQTTASKSRSNKTRLIENVQYAINHAKWTAAKKYAEERGWGFRIITEKSLFK